MDTSLFQWVIMPMLICLARIGDVSLDTVRIMLLSRGKKFLPAILGFFQVMIWLLAIRQVFLHLSNVFCYIAYAGGFAIGTYMGIILEEKLAVGIQVIRVITRKDATMLIDRLKEEGYGVTSLDAQGSMGKVNVIFTIVQRKQIPEVISVIQQYNPKAFYTVEDVKSVNEGVFPLRSAHSKRGIRWSNDG